VPLTFDELIRARRSLQDFCRLHFPSLRSVQSGISFKFKPEEKKLSSRKIEHMTTTATCLSSLLDCPDRFRGGSDEWFEQLRSKFPKKALDRPFKKWKSEGSAGVYCRCRALPIIIASSPGYDRRIDQHIGMILGQLAKKPDRFGIGEADPKERVEKWYPPNAFHTYWTLDILELLEKNFQTDHRRLSQSLKLQSSSNGMVLWARQQLGYQIGLHSATPPSSLLDTDQLAWCLAIVLRFDTALTVNLENRDFVKQALKCLFSTQVDGTWRHYKPLFHYEDAGNAYCYVFETFSVLLSCALRKATEAEMVRELLIPYSKNLMELWRHADSTKIDLKQYQNRAARTKQTDAEESGDEFGWCSGHRTNVTFPESWATACVFSYAQALRKLVGIWCREKAFENFDTPQSQLTAKEAAEKSVERGKTWSIDDIPISERLQTLFINPVRMHECIDKLEPDSQPIEKRQARSAILFGPPGTSKTSLVQFLARIVGWKYVEIHASHFVAEGLPQVQKTADRIFRELQELDHAVVLFDEIDELVRERDMEKDAFGRFLTTSMLPKLAVLWEARKILYFVATNHINYFDSAIIRSHRFDALMLVSPPSFDTKVDTLGDLLKNEYNCPKLRFEVNEEDVERELERFRDMSNSPLKDKMEQALAAHWSGLPLPDECTLAKFALLRFDEINELAYRLAKILSKRPTTRKISNEVLKEALKQVSDSEWRKNKSYSDFLRDVRSERRDYEMLNVWECTRDPKKPLPGLKPSNKRLWLARAVDSLDDVKVKGFRVQRKPDGRVELLAVKSK
jgi:hypothetical protein